MLAPWRVHGWFSGSTSLLVSLRRLSDRDPAPILAQILAWSEGVEKARVTAPKQRFQRMSWREKASRLHGLE